MLEKDPDTKLLPLDRLGHENRSFHAVDREPFEEPTFLAELLGRLPVAVVVVDLSGSILAVNLAAARLLASTPAELIGRPFSDLSPCWCAERPLPVTASERREFCRLDGRYTWVEVSGSTVAQRGRPWGWAYVLRDATVRDREQAEEQNQRRLEAMNQLATGIAHELNTPMQVAEASIEFLKGAFQDLRKLVVSYNVVLGRLGESGQLDRDLLEGIRRSEEQADLGYLEKEIPSACERSLKGIERASAVVRAVREKTVLPATDERCEQRIVDQGLAADAGGGVTADLEGTRLVGDA
ncbi:MAG: PAS domain S-box protein [Deltaproteobacteria bacterium]|nr:PAS domain S-box protein [Deltaproteobacteria bacterium]